MHSLHGAWHCKHPKDFISFQRTLKNLEQSLSRRIRNLKNGTKGKQIMMICTRGLKEGFQIQGSLGSLVGPSNASMRGIALKMWQLSSRIPTIQVRPFSRYYHRLKLYITRFSNCYVPTNVRFVANLQNPNLTSTMKHYGLPLALPWTCYFLILFCIHLFVLQSFSFLLPCRICV